MKKNKSRLFCVGIILIISLFALTACHQSTANSSNTNSSNDNISMEYISDDVLINIAMEISKEENNYTYWLFSHDKGVDNSDIIQKEIIFTHNGEDFPSVYDYALVTDFNSIKDFVDNASKCLSKEYMENYLYKLIGLHSTESIPAPLLLESDGHLYKITSADGVSHLPNIKYESGEVIEKTDSSAIVRLYVDSSVDAQISFFDYPLILEDGIWKHNPEY